MPIPTPPDGYRAVTYTDIGAGGGYVCLTCSAVISDHEEHTAWHNELREVLQALAGWQLGPEPAKDR
jgi:hypothetical protein